MRYGHVVVVIQGWGKALPGELEIKREIIDFGREKVHVYV
jgi:hypothetical protein